MTLTPLSTAHLTALELSPPEFVRRAGAAGFSQVGVRVHPSTPTETRYPMLPPSTMLDDTVRAMEDTGVTILDIEVFGLAEHIDRDVWMPVLEAGQRLGAQILNVVGTDPDQSRFVEKLGRLVEDARPYGIRPAIEPISYQPLSTLKQARDISEHTGAGIMFDALHMVRAGQTIEEIRALPQGMVAVLQLCDGMLAEPEFDDIQVPLPIGQSVSGSARQFEARAQRLMPGAGQFPLRDMVEALPGVPLSVEVPDIFAVAKTGIDAHLRRCVQTTREMLGEPAELLS